LIASKISAIFYVLLKLVFNRSYEGQQWLDTLYFVVEPLCFTLILYDFYKLHFIFEIVFYVALSSFIRQLAIYLGYWEYNFIGRKYFVEYFFLFGIIITTLRHGIYRIRENTKLDKLLNNVVLWLRTFSR
jgi:hypothetical protein